MENFWIFEIICVGACFLLVECVVLPPNNVTIIDDSNVKANQSDTTCDVTLNFSNMGLNVIKSNFISSPYIKNLILQNNSITNFVENTFDSLPNLEHLDLSNNKMSKEKLFSFGDMFSLKSLVLDNNNNDLPKDPYFRCSNNQVWDTHSYRCKTVNSELKVVFNYPELYYLSLRNINIRSVPLDMDKHFPKLYRLNLSNNDFENSADNLFESIPSTVTELILENVGLTRVRSLYSQNVTFLKLNRNSFEIISSNYCYDKTLCLKGLSNLASLIISRCSIKKIEADAFKEIGKLLYLDISDNEFQEIPDDTFDYIHSLTNLNLSRNSLLTIPNLSALQDLTTLVMDEMKNKLIFQSFGMFTKMPSLEILSLRCNELTRISSSFLNNFPNLRKLDLTNNKITFLPSWHGQNNLQELYLNQNKILNMEDLSLKEAESLQLLELKNNLVSSIKLSSLKNLPDDMILML